MLFSIREIALQTQEVIDAVAHSGAGGIDVFVGVVRDNNDGHQVTLLEYQAYKSMAEAEMKRIATEISAKIPDVRLAAIHRVGSLSVGDLAIVCAASAPHRGEAFRACKLLIDEIKARVPIWKREHGPDGPYWVGWEDARCVEHGAHDEEEHHHDHGDSKHSHHHEHLADRFYWCYRKRYQDLAGEWLLLFRMA